VDGARGVPGPGEDRGEPQGGAAAAAGDGVARFELQREFVAMVLHDLRGPATAVAGLVEVLQEGWRELDADRIDLMLRRTRAAADRIARLTDDVVAAAAMDAASFTYRTEVFDLVPVVRETVEQVAVVSGREVAVEVAGPLPLVVADADRQRQILGNLLGNAVKFAPRGGRIRVGLERDHAEVRVRVHDEGTSLTEGDVARLFEPFARVGRTADGSGAGLGLAIVRTLVRGQGGDIWVDAPVRAGDGTRFVYSVPVAPEAPNGPPAHG
jgi:two-component system, OmpR family, phosphate regulon sensor histidine kinase PhoR